ncbi:uncharacterized protein CXQ87_002513 [Candidozyma duobushaemuli]|uniref:Uncharacterized protein n=1 Tax=Candidozyma duobushaemuli TaxID=1231522 RepID=A0A2V1A8H2_9ASCO|nr:uncharacterized protein CXQ87_002513 [[Candida] duobushaemulonis]PVH14380.1 hypothetical protein CXQ87_002513 [[Candida] duobushaemulonis]
MAKSHSETLDPRIRRFSCIIAKLPLSQQTPPSSPISHKIVVGTLATLIGAWAFWQVGKDFQFVKFEPRSPEEIEKRRKEGTGLEIRSLETRSLEYTDEAKARLKRKFEESEKK